MYLYVRRKNEREITMRPWSKIQKIKTILDGARNTDTAVTIVDHDIQQVQPMNLQKTEALSAMAVGLQILHGMGESRENLKKVASPKIRRAS